MAIVESKLFEKIVHFWGDNYNMWDIIIEDDFRNNPPPRFAEIPTPQSSFFNYKAPVPTPSQNIFTQNFLKKNVLFFIFEILIRDYPQFWLLS